MESISPEVEHAFVCWINTFPDIGKTVDSFDDLCDGTIISKVLNQIDVQYTYPAIDIDGSITSNQSKLLFESLSNYFQSDADAEEAAEVRDSLFDSEAIYLNHNKSEVLFVLKLIMSIALQTSIKNDMLQRITTLDQQSQDILIKNIQEIMQSFEPEGEPEGENAVGSGLEPGQNNGHAFESGQTQNSKSQIYYDDDGTPLLTYDEIMNDYKDDDDDDFYNWDDSPLDDINGIDSSHIEQQLDIIEEKDKVIHDLQSQLLQRDAIIEEMENDQKDLTKQRDSLLTEHEELNKQILDLKKENMQIQMKNDELTSQQGSDETRTNSNSSQLLMLQSELEKSEEQNRTLTLRLNELTKSLQDVNNESEISSLQSKISMQQEQINQLQKYETLCNTYKQQLKEYKEDRNDLDDIVQKNRDLSNQLHQVNNLEEKVKSLIEDNKALQTDLILYQQRCQELDEVVNQCQEEKKQLLSDLDMMRQKNESMQVLLSPSSTTPSSPIRTMSSTTLDSLMSQSSPAPAMVIEPMKEVDVKTSKEYMEQANELMLSNEKCISLNKKIDLLNAEITSLKNQLVASTTTPSPPSSPSSSPSPSSIPYDQYHLLLIQCQVKDEELEHMKKEYHQADEERILCLKKIQQLQSDYQEMADLLTQENAKKLDLEEKRNKIASKFKSILLQLQQLNALRKNLEEQLVEQEKRNAQLYDSQKREEEVMFQCIHKLGTTSFMQSYVTNIDSYKPKGWLACVRASQAKTF